MTKASSLRTVIVNALRADDDALAPYRAPIALKLSLLSAVLLLPFTLMHLWNGQWGLGLTIAAAQGVLVWNTVALRAGRAAPVPFWLLVLVLIGAIGVSISVQPLNAAYWAYPTLFIAYFTLPRRQALLLSLLLVAMVSVLMTLGVGPAVAARTFATLTLTLVMLNVVLNVIGQLQRTLEQQATTDPLTGAYNRRHFEAQLVLLAPPPPNVTAANVLVLLDIDHFKGINDRLGHAAGDAVLQGLVAAIDARKRAGDALFRIGGEEFVLLLPRVAPADALRLAEALRQRIESATLLPGEAVTVSIGVASQRAGSDPADWLRRADAALYEAKRTGRNRVVQAE